LFISTRTVTELPKKEQLYELIRANPFISQQDLAAQLGLSRSAVANYIATLVRERRILGRAYVLPDQRPILCIGASNLDRKLRSNGKLVLGTSNPASQDESFGGVARNIAENLARLGAPVALITAVGNDASGRALLAHAEDAGIDTRGALRLDGVSSGTYTAVLDQDGEMVVALADMALNERLSPEFLATRQQQCASAALLVADLNLPHDTIAALLDGAARDGVSLVLVAVSEPKMARLPEQLRGLRLLILNEGELATRLKRPLDSDAAIGAACRELQSQGVQDVVVTRGGRGGHARRTRRHVYLGWRRDAPRCPGGRGRRRHRCGRRLRRRRLLVAEQRRGRPRPGLPPRPATLRHDHRMRADRLPRARTGPPGYSQRI